MKISGKKNTGNNEWSTPDWLFKKYNAQYNFCMDLAAATNNTKCNHYYTKEDDALKKDWTIFKGWLWCNPPYGRNELKYFYKKADEEAQRGAKIIMLAPVNTSTIAFHKHVYKKYEIEFLEGRIKFVGAKSGAMFSSMIIKFKKS